MKKSLVILIVLWLSMIAPVLAQGDCQTGDFVLCIGETETGRLTERVSEQIYTFTGTAGDVITLTMIAEDASTLDPALYLYTAEAYDAEDLELVYNDDATDGSFGTNARIEAFELPQDGEYVVMATRFVGDGAYTLTLEEATAVAMIETRQWASSATASSEYGSTSWNAMQATGEPDTDSCGDNGTAWASATSQGQDYLELVFDTAVIPTEINIYQTYNPGSIVRVELGSTEVPDTYVLANSTDPVGNTPCPGVFTLGTDLMLAPEGNLIAIPQNRVIIYFDQSIGGSWNEIDAVELVGLMPEEFVSTVETPDPNILSSGEAPLIQFTLPEGWAMIELVPQVYLIGDNEERFSTIESETLVLEPGQVIMLVFPASEFTEMTFASLEEANAALMDIMMTEDEVIGETSLVTLGGREVAKTTLTTEGLDARFYVLDVDGEGHYLGVQAAAGEMSSAEALFDEVVASITSGSAEASTTPETTGDTQTLTFADFSIDLPAGWLVDTEGVTPYFATDDATLQNVIAGGFDPIADGQIGMSFTTTDMMEGLGLSGSTASELLTTLNTIFESTDAVESYDKLDYPAAWSTYTGGIAPVGAMMIAVEYPDGLILFAVQVGGDFADFEPMIIDILNSGRFE